MTFRANLHPTNYFFFVELDWKLNYSIRWRFKRVLQKKTHCEVTVICVYINIIRILVKDREREREKAREREREREKRERERGGRENR